MNKFQQLFEGYPYLAAEVMKKSAETSQNKFSKPNIQPESQVNKNIVQPLLNKVNSLKPKINDIKKSVVNKVNDINQNISKNIKDETKYALASIPNYIKNPDLQRLVDLEKTVNNKSPRETYLAWKDNFAGQDTNPLNLDIKNAEMLTKDEYLEQVYKKMNDINKENKLNLNLTSGMDPLESHTTPFTSIFDLLKKSKNIKPEINVSDITTIPNALVRAHETKEAIELNKLNKQFSKKNGIMNVLDVADNGLNYNMGPNKNGSHGSPYTLKDENDVMNSFKKYNPDFEKDISYSGHEVLNALKDQRNQPLWSAGNNYTNWKSGENPPNKIQFNPFETSQIDIVNSPELQKEFFDTKLKNRLNNLEMKKFNQNIGKNSVIPSGFGGSEGPDRGPDLGINQNLLDKSKQYINNITNRFK